MESRIERGRPDQRSDGPRAPDDGPEDIVVRAIDYPAGSRTGRHRHKRAQLVYAKAGTMTVSTPLGLWVVPPQRAVWIPAGIEHEVRMAGPVSMRTLYIRPAAAPSLPTRCSAVNVTPLLRELILAAAALPTRPVSNGRAERIAALILDEICMLPVAPLHLPEPRDPRLRRIAAALMRDPADPRRLRDWSRTVGASSRTIARLFERETGMTFRQWQRQARLLSALPRLAEGEAVTTVALDLGYGTPSAFIEMFRRAMGTTPGRYFSDP
jgi:AraC-like DNA-binding protein/quercetin dioxygenase-like cupin family protein